MTDETSGNRYRRLLFGRPQTVSEAVAVRVVVGLAVFLFAGGVFGKYAFGTAFLIMTLLVGITLDVKRMRGMR